MNLSPTQQYNHCLSFLIHSVKQQHRACVAAPAPAMNTNTACGHVLCNKSAKYKRGEETEIVLPSCFYFTEQMLLITNYQVSGCC